MSRMGIYDRLTVENYFHAFSMLAFEWWTTLGGDFLPVDFQSITDHAR
jgi:hypothetical protein